VSGPAHEQLVGHQITSRYVASLPVRYYSLAEQCREITDKSVRLN